LPGKSFIPEQGQRAFYLIILRMSTTRALTQIRRLKLSTALIIGFSSRL